MSTKFPLWELIPFGFVDLNQVVLKSKRNCGCKECLDWIERYEVEVVRLAEEARLEDSQLKLF
jgi:hypothetical protein